MKKLLCCSLLLILILTITNTTLAVSVDDFLPPADGGSTKVENPVQKGEEGILQAQTAQDGLNQANQNIQLVHQGFEQVMFGSGMGYLAGATASYQTFENPNATQESLRLAYVTAFAKAKAELTKGLTGLSSRSLEFLAERIEDITTATDSYTNALNFNFESIDQVVEGLVLGYVVYEVDHNPQEKTVYVSIASTTKTLEAVANISGAVVQSSSLRDGLDYVLKEITRGILPPIGGKIIYIPTTGETAIVSYGSDILRVHENSAMQRRLQLASERAATMRADDAMVGILQGDQVIWASGLDTTAETNMIEFERVVDENSNVQFQALEELQHQFMSTFAQTDDFLITREGNVPPGVTRKLAYDDHWVYAINVYLPSLSQHAQNFYEQMQQAGQGDSGGTGNKKIIDKNYIPSENNSPVQQGPSGKVSSPDDL